MKQSAVEWVLDRIIQDKKHNDISDKVWEDLFEQAKEMEKQQIIDAYDLGMGHYGDANRRSDAEQYYNETFKK